MDKIVVFSNMYPSKDHPTFGIFVKNQVELLREADIDVEIIAINNPKKGKVTTLKKYMSWFFRSFIYILKNRRTISLTHAHYAFPTGLISLLGKKFFGIPYVVTVHGGDIDQMAKKSGRIKKLTSDILNEAAKVIVVGEKLKENVISQFGVSESHVEVMSMGVNTEMFMTGSQVEMRKKLGLADEQKIILFVGNVIESKGLLELVEAVAQLKKAGEDCGLYIIGAERDEIFSTKLRQSIAESGLTSIRFLQPLGQKELAQWMVAADVLALPSHHEGFGLVALEAMATKLKVVGTDVGGLSYLLADRAGIIVQPKDPVALAEGLTLALQDENSDVISEEIVEKRTSEHSYEAILRKLLAIYEPLQKK